MYIKSITFEDHILYGRCTFNFCDDNGKPFNTIIIAGENGTGKSTLLNEIYNFLHSPYDYGQQASGVTTFVFELTNNDRTSFLANQDFSSRVRGYEIENQLTITVDNKIRNNWSSVKTTISRKEGEPISFESSWINSTEMKRVFKSIFSDVDVNYKADSIQSTTSLDIDRELVHDYVVKSTADVGKEIAQLLVDIEALDSDDFKEWATQNPDSIVSEGITDNRMRRFKSAFESIFPHKKYKKVVNTDSGKQVYFEEFGKQISINDLSSGEKQIVFRGSFLLRNKRSTEGAVILIDEPEISLHPKWQLKILDFYKNLFIEDGLQTSQLFIATHSPFVIHNETRKNDKVLILKKDKITGKTDIPEQGEFFSWTDEQFVKEAFDIDFLQNKIETAPENLIITEGKTDWKHLKKALEEVKHRIQIDRSFAFLEYEDEIEMGSSHLLTLCKSLSKINNNKKIIAIFDRDEPNIINQVSENNGVDFKYWGNNVYSFVLPIPPHRVLTPNIAIEHYYTNEEIKLEDSNSRRLYMGYEFSSKTGIHQNNEKICTLRNKCGVNKINIIDSDVFLLNDEDNNIALTKNHFAQNIYMSNEPFNNVNSESFIPIFQMINSITDDET